MTDLDIREAQRPETPTDRLYPTELLPEWHLEAECRGSDVDLFFPERGESTRKAKAMCAVCPVSEACLDYALDNNEKWGIWGGLSERARRTERHRRAA